MGKTSLNLGLKWVKECKRFLHLVKSMLYLFQRQRLGVAAKVSTLIVFARKKCFVRTKTREKSRKKSPKMSVSLHTAVPPLAARAA